MAKAGATFICGEEEGRFGDGSYRSGPDMQGQEEGMDRRGVRRGEMWEVPGDARDSLYTGRRDVNRKRGCVGDGHTLGLPLYVEKIQGGLAVTDNTREE